MINSIDSVMKKLEWTDAFIEAVHIAAGSSWDAISRVIVSPDALPDVDIRVCLPAEHPPYVWFRCKKVETMSLPFSYELAPMVEQEPACIALVWNREDKLSLVRCDSIVIARE